MSFINTNEIINHIKARLGGLAHRIELSDEDINRLIHENTLKTLSVYFPLRKKVIVTNNERVIDPTEIGDYILPESDDTVLNIVQLVPPNYGYGRSGFNSYNYYTENSIVSTMLDGLGTIPFLPMFLPPNRLNIVPNPPSNWEYFTLLVNVQHKDFTTLTPGLREIVLKLCLLDVKLDILAIRSYFTNINTEFANIELNLGSLESAVSERDELLEKLRTKQLFNGDRKKIWRF
jgi:hypothetical protein